MVVTLKELQPKGLKVASIFKIMQESNENNGGNSNQPEFDLGLAEEDDVAISVVLDEIHTPDPVEQNVEERYQRYLAEKEYRETFLDEVDSADRQVNVKKKKEATKKERESEHVAVLGRRDSKRDDASAGVSEAAYRKGNSVWFYRFCEQTGFRPKTKLGRDLRDLGQKILKGQATVPNTFPTYFNLLIQHMENRYPVDSEKRKSILEKVFPGESVQLSEAYAIYERRLRRGRRYLAGGWMG